MSTTEKCSNAMEVPMFLAAVLNAYLQPADAADAKPALDLSVNEAQVPAGLALAKVEVRPRSEHGARTQSDARQARARW
jgi:hypothetical protein